MVELLWIAIGLSSPVWLSLVVPDSPHASPPVLWIGIAAVAIVAAQIRLDFRIGPNTVGMFAITIPLSAAFVLAIPPGQVAVICLASALATADPWRYGTPKLPWLYSTATWAIAGGITALVADTLAPRGVEAAIALPAALGLMLLYDLLDLIPHEARERVLWGDTLVTNDDIRVSIGEASVGAVAAGLIVPIAQAHSLAAVATTGALLGLAIALSRLTTSHARHQSKADYLQDAFSRYVPSTVAAQVGDAAADIELGGEERLVSVLFCDIRGFTAWSEHQQPDEVVAQLNELLRELSAAVLENEGTLDKYTGDGLMAFWGAPLDQPDHADKAAAAAMQMILGLERCNRTRQQQGQAPFAIGIGIHTGLAVVGNIGHENRLDYTAIGDTVNTSARLEAATKDAGAEILVSDQTRELLSPNYSVRCMEAGEFRVKGRTEPIVAFELKRMGLVADPGRGSLAAPTSAPRAPDEPGDELLAA